MMISFGFGSEKGTWLGGIVRREVEDDEADKSEDRDDVDEILSFLIGTLQRR